MSAATKNSSGANFLPPFIFPALSLRNSLLCRISCYQQPALHNTFQLSQHVKGAGKGEPASQLSPAAPWQTQTQTPKNSSLTQVHFSIPPSFNRKDNSTRNILAMLCCACWRLETKTDAIYCQQYFCERLPSGTSASASIRSLTLTRASLYLYQLRPETALAVGLPWKSTY